MPKYTSNRQRKLKVGITSYTENLTVLEVTGGAYISSSVGIGTTVPSQSLHVQGNARITGAIYDSTNLPGNGGQVLQSTATGTLWVNPAGVGVATYSDRAGIATYADRAGIATYADTAGIATNVIGGIASITSLSVSGISTFGTVQIFSGIITATSGIVTYYGDGSKLTNIQASAIVGGTGYVDIAGVSTNVIGGIASITSLSVSGISTLGRVQISSGIVTASTGVVTYYGDGSKLTNILASAIAGIVSYSDRAGIATYADTAGIATYATLAGIATYADYAGIATYATLSGIATYANYAGIATYSTLAGIATYAGIAGIATYTNQAGIATYADTAGVSTFATYANVAGIATYTNVAGIATYANYVGIATYATIAGVSTDVIGGIASITSLNVSGISTLGTVQVSSGIVTASTGIVTYYGDGSKLTGVGAQLTITPQDPVSSVIYPTLAGNVGVSSLGISTSKLSFIPSTNKLGVGTGTPRENLDVIGTIGIQSEGASNRFYMQYNTSLNSLDFIFV
jgi:hypothetical protein